MNRHLFTLLLTMILSVVGLHAYASVKVYGIYYNFDSSSKTAEVTMNPSNYTGSVVIPETVVYEETTYSVTSIGYGAFWGCTSLTSITIPNSVEIIGYKAFSQCYALTSITIPNSVTIIGEGVFQYCTGLTSVTIGNSVTSIGACAFWGCRSLTSITIPNSLTSIDNNAFYGCI